MKILSKPLHIFSEDVDIVPSYIANMAVTEFAFYTIQSNWSAFDVVSLKLTVSTVWTHNQS